MKKKEGISATTTTTTKVLGTGNYGTHSKHLLTTIGFISFTRTNPAVELVTTCVSSVECQKKTIVMRLVNATTTWVWIAAWTASRFDFLLTY